MPKRERFPGFEACLKMMGSRNAQIAEDGFHFHLPHAGDYLDQLIAAYFDESNISLFWLLELIGETRSPAAMPILLERLHDECELVRDGAIHAQRKLNTKEARRALWEAGIPTHRDRFCPR